jgi:REP element-mobilizing transposase RayT
MTRYARINVPFGIYHIISRILRGEHLISGAEERLHYLRLLGQVSKSTDAQVLAWCLMSSHIHLVIRAGREPLSRLMKPVNSGFGVWLAKRIGKRGPVFADRYKSILVDEEAYLFQLVRYVHNNPVRAGVVAEPADSVWTSHREYLGRESCPSWLKMGYVLGMFSSDADEARQLFHQFVLEGRKEGRRPDLCGEGLRNMGREIQSGFGDGWRISGPIVGSQEFAAKVLSDIDAVDQTTRTHISLKDVAQPKTPNLNELIGVTSAVLGLEPWEFEQQPRRRGPALARRIITYLWVQKFNRPQIEVVRHFCLSTSTVFRWYSKALREVNKIDPLCDAIISRLTVKEGAETPKENEARIRFNLQFEKEE